MFKPYLYSYCADVVDLSSSFRLDLRRSRESTTHLQKRTSKSFHRGFKVWKNPIHTILRRPKKSSGSDSELAYSESLLSYPSNRRLAKGVEEKGFISLLGLSFIFLVLGGLLILFQTGQGLKEKFRLSSECVHKVLHLQNQLSKPLERLLALNPQASRLRLRRLLAEAKIAAGIPAGVAELAIITQQQLMLATRQKTLLMQAQILRQEFLPHVGESRSLAVHPTPPTSLTPNYELVSNFSEVQGQTLKLKKYQDGLVLSYACSATLGQELNQWIPKLKPVKVSWR